MKFSIKKILVLSTFSFIALGIYSTSAQTQTLTMPTGATDPTQSSFRVIICDGPAALNTSSTHQISNPNGGGTITDPKWHEDPNFRACDFNGAMMQIQHLIDIFMVLGVFAAIILFTYAGFLLMTGKEDDRKKAKSIFPKVAVGFIIMLSAWFIVFQLLNWLTGNGIFTKLLGS